MNDIKELVRELAKSGVAADDIAKVVMSGEGNNAGVLMASMILDESRKIIKPSVLNSPKCGAVALDFMTAVIKGIQGIPNDMDGDASATYFANMVTDLVNVSVDRLNRATEELEV